MATADTALPVFFYVQGGGFTGSALPPNGTSLVKTGSMVVVTLTYRVGPYGFLGGVVPKPNMSLRSAPDFSLNNGLKDQLKALEWVRTYIASFGGDPEHIVLGGASAGAGSVVIHMANPDTNGSFVGAAIESAAWPRLQTAQEAHFEYENILRLTGCAGKWDTLGCLREIDTATFQRKTRGKTLALSGADSAPVYMYGPVLDGDIVRDYTYSVYYNNHENEVPVLVGDTTNEGIVFTPASAGRSLAAADSFVKSQFPLSTKNLTYFHSHPHYKPLIDAGNYRSFAAQLYGDIRYVCPNLFLGWTLPSRSKNANIWTYHWDVAGATHIAETFSVWNGFSGKNNTLAPLQTALHAYWVSFIIHLDPNTKSLDYARKGNARMAAPATWQRAATTQKTRAGSRILFTDKAAKPLAPKMEKVDANQWDACVTLANLGIQLKQ